MMSLLVRTGLSPIVTDVKEHAIKGKNAFLRTVKRGTSQTDVLSSVVGIFSRQLTIASYVRMEKVLPEMVRGLQGADEILTLALFTGLFFSFFPHLRKENLDEKALKDSLQAGLKRVENPLVLPARRPDKNTGKPPRTTEKWEKLIVKHAKESFDKATTEKTAKAELAAYLVSKGSDVEMANRIAQSLTLSIKKDPMIVRFYSSLFIVPVTLGALKVLDNWKVVELAFTAVKFGKGYKIFGVVLSVGLRPAALVASIAANSIKLGYQGYKVVTATIVIWTVKESSEILKAQQDRTKALWNVVSAGMNLTIKSVPLVFAVNPVIFLTFEIGSAIVSIIVAVKY